MVENVIRLVDTAPGYAMSDTSDLGQWAASWCESLRDGSHGPLRSISIVVETSCGRLAVLNQGTSPMDMARVAGLLSIASMRVAAGISHISNLEPDSDDQ